MTTSSHSNLIDLITTIFLFLIGLGGLFKSLDFPDRSGMWPTFVMAALLISAGIHLLNLFRKRSQPHQEELTVNGHQNGG